jgi:uncharacterized protein YjbI with pentapeptide repeats
MAPRRSAPTVIGVVQSPEVEVRQLRAFGVESLDDRMLLEEVLVESASLGGAQAGSVRMVQACLRDVDLGEARLRALHLTDVIAERVDAANGDWGGGEMRRVSFRDARLTGLNLSEAHIAEASFEGCRLDYVNFRHSRIEHALFEDCVLRSADFQSARIEATRFANCQLVDADFSKAQLSLTDLRGCELALTGSMLGLGGAIIDSLQLMDLAGALAAELGIAVQDA